MAGIVLPRNFVLLEELENFEKGKYPGDCSIGIKDMDDMYLHCWIGLIITNPERSIIGEQFININIYCGDNYPNEPPEVQLTPPPEGYKIYCNKVQVVDDDGTVNVNLPIIKGWTKNSRMIDVVKQLKTVAERGKL